MKQLIRKAAGHYLFFCLLPVLCALFLVGGVRFSDSLRKQQAAEKKEAEIRTTAGFFVKAAGPEREQAFRDLAVRSPELMLRIQCTSLRNGIR